jgi:hypothetical protein
MKCPKNRFKKLKSAKVTNAWIKWTFGFRIIPLVFRYCKLSSLNASRMPCQCRNTDYDYWADDVLED